jgi:hypothetical protein
VPVHDRQPEPGTGGGLAERIEVLTALFPSELALVGIQLLHRYGIDCLPERWPDLLPASTSTPPDDTYGLPEASHAPRGLLWILLPKASWRRLLRLLRLLRTRHDRLIRAVPRAWRMKRGCRSASSHPLQQLDGPNQEHRRLTHRKRAGGDDQPSPGND